MAYNVVEMDVHDLPQAPHHPPQRRRHLRAVETHPTRTAKAWTARDATELRAAADEFPLEIGASSMLDLIVEVEGLGL